jgi:hypothetical protein
MQKAKTMKLKLIIGATLFTLAFSSCQKCVTCVPYKTVSGSLVRDDGTGGSQSIKLCDKVDIKAYETSTSFQDANRNPIIFVCK